MRVGIVGSRRRNTLADRKIVFDIVREAIRRDPNVVIISGGCPQGADAFAKEAALLLKAGYFEYPIPTEPPVKNKWEFTQRAYARNRKIAEDSDVIYALVHHDRSGGTENTIAHGIELKKHLFVVDQEGRLYLSQDATASNKVGSS